SFALRSSKPTRSVSEGACRAPSLTLRVSQVKESYSNGFDLPVLQFHRHRPPEDRHLDPHVSLGLEQILDLPLHAAEGAVADLDAVEAVEARLDLLVLLGAFAGPLHLLDLVRLHRLRRLVQAAADEIAYARGLAEEVQNVLVVLDLDHQVAGVE